MIDECGEQFLPVSVFHGGNCTLYSYLTTNMNLRGEGQTRVATPGTQRSRVCARVSQALETYPVELHDDEGRI